MRVAAVDIGTNTVRLLVADVVDGRLDEVTMRSRIAGLGVGVDRTGRLGEGGIGRALVAVEGYGALVRHLGVAAVRAVATSATRDASNGDSFLDRAGLALGIRPEVIGGDEEAALAFRGALAGAVGDGPFLVIDPGGGSTEFVYGTDAPEYVVSVDIGSVRLTERCLSPLPASPEDVDAARAETRRVLAAVELPGVPAVALAVASRPIAIAAHELDASRYDRRAVRGMSVTAAQLDRVIVRLAELSVEETAALPWVDPVRAPVILGAVIVVREALALAGTGALTMATGDTLEGIALALAEG